MHCVKSFSNDFAQTWKRNRVFKKFWCDPTPNDDDVKVKCFSLLCLNAVMVGSHMTMHAFVMWTADIFGVGTRLKVEGASNQNC